MLIALEGYPPTLHSLFQENFKKVSLKTATATAHIPVIGDFTIKLEDVKLTALDVDKSSTGVSLGEDGTFVLLVDSLAAVVEGHFQWRRAKFPFISGGCQVRVTAEVRLCFVPSSLYFLRHLHCYAQCAHTSLSNGQFEPANVRLSKASPAWEQLACRKCDVPTLQRQSLNSHLLSGQHAAHVWTKELILITNSAQAEQDVYRNLLL